jgi:hypothetical protein
LSFWLRRKVFSPTHFLTEKAAKLLGVEGVFPNSLSHLLLERRTRREAARPVFSLHSWLQSVAAAWGHHGTPIVNASFTILVL